MERDLRALKERGESHICSIGAVVGAVSAIGGAIGSVASVAGPIASIAGAVGTVGNLLGGGDSSGGTDAANAQTDAANRAIDLQKYIYDTNRGDQAPWRQIGQDAITQLENFTKPGFDLSSWLKSQPGYQFGIDQGVNTIDRSAAAAGSLNSGGTLKALDRFGQDYAQGTLTNAFNRLATLAGFGQTANQQGLANGQNYANQAGQNYRYIGNAQASGILSNQAMQNYQMQQLPGAINSIGNAFSSFGNMFGGSNNYSGANFGGTNTAYTGPDITTAQLTASF